MKKSVILMCLLFGVFFTAQAGDYEQLKKLVSSDRAINDYFGYSVSISGDYAIVGAVYDDENASGDDYLYNAGSAYIFKWDGISWNQQAKLVPSDRLGAAPYYFNQYNANFGFSVSISGDYAIVGVINRSAAYIFKRDGTSWEQQAMLSTVDEWNSNAFGCSVSISGDYVIVGAKHEDEGASGGDTLSNAGAAYIYKRDGTSWTQQAKVVATYRVESDQFGYSVSISDDYAIVGACYQDDELTDAGSAYIFHRDNSTWSPQTKIVASDRADADQFGFSVSISGDHAIIGARLEDEDASGGNTLTNAGSAYIFNRVGTSWNQQIKLLASDRADEDQFGFSVSISGKYAVVGAQCKDESDSSFTDVGSAYIFRQSGGTWIQEKEFLASDCGTGDYFGSSVSVSGNKAIVGAKFEDEDAYGRNTLSKAGSAYIFSLPNPIAMKPAEFSLLAPGDSTQVNSLNPTFTWQTAFDLDPFDTVSYVLVLDTPEPDIVEYQVGVDTTYTIPQSLVDHTKYFWKVIAIDLSGETRENTGGYQSFTTNSDNDIPSTASPISPDSVIVLTLKPNFAWRPAVDLDPEDSLYYKVKVWNNESGDSLLTDSLSSIFETALHDNSEYFWNVEACDKSSSGQISRIAKFWTDLFPEAPAQFNTINPVDQEILQVTFVDLNWKKAHDPDPLDYTTYTLKYKSTHQDSTLWHEIEVGPDTSYSLELTLGNRYEWQVIAKDDDGFEVLSDSSNLRSFDVGNVSGLAFGIPEEYTLSQNYPNPFNPNTTISYSIFAEATMDKQLSVNLSIFNMSGHKVVTLVNEVQSIGYYEFNWNASDFSSGIYFYRLQAGNYVDTKKMILMK